jgi:hypothetical protein
VTAATNANRLEKSMKNLRLPQLVYFVQSVEGGPIKIGKSDIIRFRDRLIALQQGNPVELKLIGSFAGGYASEKELHEELAEYRVRGEWFQDHPFVLRVMNGLVRLYGIEPAL